MSGRQKLALVFGVVVVAASIYAPAFVYGSAKPVHLKYDPTAAATSAALVSGNNYQPVLGLDYTISNTAYFDAHQWVVVSIEPIGTALQPGKIVFKVSDGAYQKILGPSNFFQSNDLEGLPSDVQGYLQEGAK